jgi:hypothetical protein
VLIDPSVFIFAITSAIPGRADPFSQQCYWLLHRCRVRSVQGLVSTLTLARIWKQLEALAMVKQSQLQENAIQHTLVRGFPAISEAFAFGSRVAELAASSLSIISIERQDFEHALALTRNQCLDIDSALTLAAAERDYGPRVQVATGLGNFDRLKMAGRIDFELFRAGDVFPKG